MVALSNLRKVGRWYFNTNRMLMAMYLKVETNALKKGFGSRVSKQKKALALNCTLQQLYFVGLSVAEHSCSQNGFSRSPNPIRAPQWIFVLSSRGLDLRSDVGAGERRLVTKRRRVGRWGPSPRSGWDQRSRIWCRIHTDKENSLWHPCPGLPKYIYSMLKYFMH